MRCIAQATGWAIALALGLFGARAGAQGLEGLALRWDGPADCAAPPRLHAQVAELLGDDFQESGPVEVRVRLLRTQRGYLLSLTVRSGAGAGHRELMLSSCGEVQEAVPVLIALSLDPDRVPPDAKPEPAPAPEPDAVRGHEAQSPGERPWAVGVLAGVDTATRSSVSPLVQLRGSLQRRWLQAHADLSLVVPLADRLGTSAVQVRSGMWAAGLGACAGPHFGRLWAAACAGAELGMYWAQSRGIDVTRADRALWAAGRLGGQLTHPLGPLSLQLEVSASLPLTRPTLALDDLGTLHTTAPASLRATLGLLARLGAVETAPGGH